VRAIFAAAGLAALLLAPPARAEFEGVVEGKVTGMMSGTFRAQVGKAGIRSEVEMDTTAVAQASKGQLPPGLSVNVKRINIQRKAEPGKVYLIDPERKSYMVIDASENGEAMKDAARESYTVKKLGKDKVAGFSCEKVAVTGEKSGEMQMCVADELAPEWAQSALQSGRGSGGLVTALKKAGVQGYPVRWSRGDGRGGTITMELTSAKRQSIPASAFEIPAGYQEQKGFGGRPGMGGGDAQKQMEEAMKRLTPEQRKQMEQMMKGQRQGSP